jgi:hypothetical protein
VLGIAGLILSIIPRQETFIFAVAAGAVAGAIVGGAFVYLSKIRVAREAKRARDNPRYFSAPWSVEEREASFVVRDAIGQPLSHCHFENGLARFWDRKQLTKDEARRIALSIANLPNMLPNSVDLVTSIESIRDAAEQSFGSGALPAREHFETLTDECDAIASMISRSTADRVIRRQIVEELSRALEQLGADRLLLSTVGSIGDSMRDQDVLTMLRGWNSRSDASASSTSRNRV